MDGSFFALGNELLQFHRQLRSLCWLLSLFNEIVQQVSLMINLEPMTWESVPTDHCIQYFVALQAFSQWNKSLL